MLRSLSAAVLKHAPLYILFQRMVGAAAMRTECIVALGLLSGERVLDIGCGPAYYLDELPRGVEYYGFDTDADYIAYARRRFAGKGTFFCEHFEERHARELPRFDAVMLMGLLHHLPDAACHDLLDRVARVIAPGGRVVTLDSCFDPSLTPVAHWISDHDRGRHVRPISAFEQLAKSHFEDVRGRLLGNTLRVPVAQYLMLLRGARRPASA
jgi:SAM-dependent methyltransferase